MRHFLLSLLALLGVGTMASAADAVVVNTVTLTQVETSTGVYDLSEYISSEYDLTITSTGSITFTAVGMVGEEETTATYTADSWSDMTIPTLIALTSGWYIGDQVESDAINWDTDSPTSLTLEGVGITEVKVGGTQISVGMSYPSVVDLSSTETAEPSVLDLLQGTVTDGGEPGTTYELLDLTIVFTSPEDHTSWLNVQVGGMYSGTWLCTATLVEENADGEDQTAVITCEELKAAFDAALSENQSITNKTVDYSKFSGLQIQVNGTVIKSVSYTYDTPATEEQDPATPANKTWRFDDQSVFANLYTDDIDEDGKLKSDFSTEDGLTITVGSGTVKPQTEGGTVMIGEDGVTGYPIVVTFENRLQLGTGSISKANIGIEVEGACTIYLVAASSNGTTDRGIKVAEGKTETEIVLTAINSNSQETTNCLLSYEYSGESKETIYFYSADSSINFFYIYVSYDGSAPEFTDAVVVKPVAEPEWLFVGEYLCGTDEALGVSGSSNIVEITWAEIGDATAIKFEIVYNEGETTAWAPGAIYSIADFAIGKVADLPAETPQDGVYSSCEEIYTVEALKALVDNDEGFFFSGWDIYGINVYAYATELGSKDTESGTEGDGNQEGVVVLPKAGDSFIDRFANQTGIWGGDDYTSEVVNGQVTWTTAGNWSGIGAWFNSGVDEDVAGLSIKMIAGGTGKVKAYVQWTGDCVEGSNVEVEATSATEEITLTIAFDKTSADKYENSDFRQVCVQFEGVTTSEAIFTEAVLLDDTETAISDIKSDIEVTEVARYNLMGQKISGAERGINIIVYSDGSAKKVLVK